MSLIMMTAREAMELKGEDAIVFVSISKCSEQEAVSNFEKKRYGDCFDLLNSAKAIYHNMGELIESLTVFSELATDKFDNFPQTYRGTILLQSDKTDK